MALDVWGASNIFVASVHQLIVTVLMLSIIYKLLQAVFKMGGAISEKAARNRRIREGEEPDEGDTERRKKKYKKTLQMPNIAAVHNGNSVSVAFEPVEDGIHYVIEKKPATLKKGKVLFWKKWRPTTWDVVYKGAHTSNQIVDRKDIEADVDYKYRIRAFASDKAKSDWNECIATATGRGALPAPNMTAAHNGTSVSLAFQAVNGGISYVIERSRALGWKGIYKGAHSATPIVDKDGIDPKKDYKYRIKAIGNENLESDWNECTASTTGKGILKKPDISAVHNGTSVSVAFQPVNDAQNYVVERSRALGWKGIYKGAHSATPIVDKDGIDPKKDYKYRIKAIGNENLESDWNECTAKKTDVGSGTITFRIAYYHGEPDAEENAEPYHLLDNIEIKLSTRGKIFPHGEDEVTDSKGAATFKDVPANSNIMFTLTDKRGVYLPFTSTTPITVGANSTHTENILLKPASSGATRSLVQLSVNVRHNGKNLSTDSTIPIGQVVYSAAGLVPQKAEIDGKGVAKISVVPGALYDLTAVITNAGFGKGLTTHTFVCLRGSKRLLEGRRSSKHKDTKYFFVYDNNPSVAIDFDKISESPVTVHGMVYCLDEFARPMPLVSPVKVEMPGAAATLSSAPPSNQQTRQKLEEAMRQSFSGSTGSSGQGKPGLWQMVKSKVSRGSQQSPAGQQPAAQIPPLEGEGYFTATVPRKGKLEIAVNKGMENKRYTENIVKIDVPAGATEIVVAPVFVLRNVFNQKSPEIKIKG